VQGLRDAVVLLRDGERPLPELRVDEECRCGRPKATHRLADQLRPDADPEPDRRGPIARRRRRGGGPGQEYVRERGFVDAGELLLLDDTFVAATELRHVGAELSRELRRSEAEELYFLDLLRGADEGERPPAEEVPDAFRSAYGLAVADAVGDYQRDLRTYLDDHPHPEARSVSGSVRDHRKRIEALDGDVDPKDAESASCTPRETSASTCYSGEGRARSSRRTTGSRE